MIEIFYLQCRHHSNVTNRERICTFPKKKKKKMGQKVKKNMGKKVKKVRSCLDQTECNQPVKGEASNYITRAQAVRKLQINLSDFRYLDYIR